MEKTRLRPARSVKGRCYKGEAACLIPSCTFHVLLPLTLGMQERKGLTSMLVSMTLS